MRIVFISPRYSGGGAERCARELFEQTRAAGHDARMLVARRAPGDPAGVTVVRYPGERYLRALEWIGLGGDRRHLGSIRALARLGSGNVDVVHLHNAHGGWMSIRAVARLCARVPVVWTLHDEWGPTGGLGYDLGRVLDDQTLSDWFGPGPVLSSRDPRAVRARRLLDRGGGMPRPQAVIVPSHYMAGLARDSGRFDGIPMHTIPYGVTMLGRPEVVADRTVCRQDLGISPDARVVLLVAANFSNPYKGIPLAEQALARLRDRQVTLLIVGAGGKEIAARVGLPAICPGFITDEGRLAMAYRAADVTLIPSIADNFPYVALESMACGTPLVAFRIGGLTEMLAEGERGLAASPFDVVELASNVERLLDDPALRRRLGDAGSAWVRQHCDVGRYVARHLDLYQAARDDFARASGEHTVARGGAVEANR